MVGEVTGTTVVRVEVNTIVVVVSQVENTVDDPRVPTEVEQGTKVVFVIVSVSVAVLNSLTLAVVVVVAVVPGEMEVVVMVLVAGGGGGTMPVPVPKCLRSAQ